MSRIPHVHRFGARYAYRRRLHFRNLISTLLTVSLRTADPIAARMRAAMLSARFEIVKARIESMLETGPALTGEQIEEIFRRALEDELNGLLDDAYANAPWSASVPDVAASIAEACRNLRRPNRPLSPPTSRRDVPPQPGEYAHLAGADFYAAQIVAIRADVMGHARTTVNGKSYSKRLATEGLTVLLGEHKAFMARYVPTITGNLDPQPIRLLPIDKRSRVGSPRDRKVRSDAGKKQA